MMRRGAQRDNKVVASMEPYTVVLQDHTSGAQRWLAFGRPVEIVAAHRVDAVIPSLCEVKRAVARGMYAVGFVTYEAGAAMDGALRTHAPGRLPLVWFGLYATAEIVTLAAFPSGRHRTGRWRASVPAAEYEGVIDRIKRDIAAGETYQVNFTMRLRSAFAGDPWSLFLALEETQRGRYCAYLNLGQFHICSASPELFFSLQGRRLLCRPMKGTIQRGACAAQDAVLVDTLKNSAKNRAENVMIVDMIRSDVGKIATAGTVHVTELFQVEKFPTILQMTSAIEAEVSPDIVAIFRSLFPCASITGAPKVRTMEIIHRLEPQRRDIYTGAIGLVCPDGSAQFNVAIRTVLIDAAAGVATYGVGGGVVWDSVARDEYAECRQKARVLFTEFSRFEIVETILWDRIAGYHLLDGHLDRLGDAARYFGCKFSRRRVYAVLMNHAIATDSQRVKVRVLLGRAGMVAIESAPVEALRGARVGIARRPISTRSPFVCHKTTNRQIYDAALRMARRDSGELHDVLLWNDAGLVTESCYANVVVDLDGRLVTPGLGQGLLPGVFRRALIEQRVIEERDVTLADLRRADRLFLVNSVRGWMALKNSATDENWRIESEGSFRLPG